MRQGLEDIERTTTNSFKEELENKYVAAVWVYRQ